MSDVDDAPTASGELLLDPFSYHPGHASVIRGLGGAVRPDNPGYALHTQYVRAAEGPAHFILRFAGLRARSGTLQLRVHIFVKGPPDRFLLANTVRIQLNRLVQLGGEIAVRFEGVRGAEFAIHGSVLDETDASADGLVIALDRPLHDGEDEATAAAATPLRNTEFGTTTARPVPLLLATGEPTLARVVSQVATRRQLAEPACAEWSARLGLADHPARAMWSAAYVLQSIQAYGMWREGARGLGFGGDAAAIARVLDEAGIDVETATLPDLPERLPGALGDVDFLWTIDAAAYAGVRDAFGYVERLQSCLRPGGVAVHVLPFLPGREQRPETPATLAFRRGEIERLALAVIGRGDEMAQLRIDGDEPLVGDTAEGVSGVGAFGIVIRKAPLRDM